MKSTRIIQDNFSHGYHETKQHTDILFPFNIYICTIPDDFPSVFLHWQETMEIIYIKKGKGTAQIDLNVFEVKKGDIVFAPPGHLHGLSQVHGERMEYENIIFDLSFIGGTAIDMCSQKYLIPLQQGQLSLPLCITPEDICYRKAADCLDDADILCETHPDGYELGIKADMLRLFSVIFQYYTSNDIPDALSSSDTSCLSDIKHASNSKQFSYQKHPSGSTLQNLNRLKAVLDFIEKNYQHPVTVDETALWCGYSSSHFMRWFRQMTGTSFIRFLNRFRLEKAFLELKNTDKTVLEISSQTGFDNLSNFNRLFKRQFHMTPRELRMKKTSEAVQI